MGGGRCSDVSFALCMGCTERGECYRSTAHARAQTHTYARIHTHTHTYTHTHTHTQGRIMRRHNERNKNARSLLSTFISRLGVWSL